MKKRGLSKAISALLTIAMLVTMLSAGMVVASATHAGTKTIVDSNNDGVIENSEVDAALSGVAPEDTYDIEFSTSHAGGVTEIGDNAFNNDYTYGAGAYSGLVKVTIPDTVTTIGDYAFSNCYALAEVVFEATSELETIGANAFNSCYALAEIELPDSLITIGEYAFLVCDLSSVTIPEHVTDIGQLAFCNNPNLCEVIFMGPIPTIAEESSTSNQADAFRGGPVNLTIYRDSGETGWSSITTNYFYYDDYEGTRIYYVYDIKDLSAYDFNGNCIITGFHLNGISDSDISINGNVITIDSNLRYDIIKGMIQSAESTGIAVPAGFHIDVTYLDDDTGHFGEIALIEVTDDILSRLYVVYVHGEGTDDNNPPPPPPPGTYTVTYNSNYAPAVEYKVTGLAYNASHKVLELSAAGFTPPENKTFSSWNTKADGSGTSYAPGNGLTVTSNITLYAQWVSEDRELDRENHFAYIIGYPDGTVGPDGNITRAETATIFFRLLTQSARAGMWSTAGSFTDVSAGQWFNNAISTLENGGILAGYGEEFGPDEYITRAEFAAIAVRFADTSKLSADEYDGNFTDIADHRFESSIMEAAQLGYIEGYGDGTFRPDAKITRAEVVKLLNRVLDRLVEDEDDMLQDMLTWSDNTPDKWFYFDIQEATNSHFYERKTAGGVAEEWTELRTAPNWSVLERMGASASSLTY